MQLHSRTDATITRAVLTAVAVIAPVVLVAVPAIDWLRGEPLTWAGSTGEGRTLDGAAAGASLTWDGQAQATIEDAGTGLWLGALATGLVLAAAVVAVALLLRYVVGQIRAGRPFTEGSLKALRTVGVVIAATSVVQPLVDGFATSAIMARAVAGDDGFEVGFGFSPLWLLTGMLVLAVAEAFRSGLRLTQDVEGLV